MANDRYSPQHDTRPPSTASSQLVLRRQQDLPVLLGETPEEPDSPKVSVEKRTKKAAGLEAIYQTVRFGFREMGVARTLRTYLAVNKEDGFDCQSCAWPSPDTKRKVAEFCENGSKAIADELTRRKAEPSFFAEHPVAELVERSDYWLNAQGRLTHPMIKREAATHFEPGLRIRAHRRCPAGAREPRRGHLLHGRQNRERG